MAPTTPSGTRTWSMRTPFGSERPRTVSPIGSVQGDDLEHGVGESRDPALVEREPVEQAGRQAAIAPGVEVERVRGDDLGGAIARGARRSASSAASFSAVVARARR